MITTFQEKLNEGLISLEFGETGIIVIERRFDEKTGVPIMKPTQEVSSKQIDDILADKQKYIGPLLQEIQDLTDMKVAVLAKEEDRNIQTEANQHPKDKKK